MCLWSLFWLYVCLLLSWYCLPKELKLSLLFIFFSKAEHSLDIIFQKGVFKFCLSFWIYSPTNSFFRSLFDLNIKFLTTQSESQLPHHFVTRTTPSTRHHSHPIDDIFLHRCGSGRRRQTKNIMAAHFVRKMEPLIMAITISDWLRKRS